MVIAERFAIRGGERFDALFIPTKNNQNRVSELLKEITRLNISNEVFILPSSVTDIPKPDTKTINIHKEFRSFCEDFDQNFDCITWDLPYKRNFAIWFSKINSFKRILLLDDDIRFTNFENSAYNLLAALDNNWVAGAYSIGEFDTSLIGEVSMRTGINQPAFLSGNCLAINIEMFIPFFPNIYNEDRFAFLPVVILGKATIVGPVLQLKRRYLNYKQATKFQEFGEVIADELYSHIAHPRQFGSLSSLVARINQIDYWSTVLKDRDEWLEKLENYICAEGNRRRDTEIVRAARSELSNIDAKECVSFICKWQHDIKQWCNRIKLLTKAQNGDY